jgi:hypothetical protein
MRSAPSIRSTWRSPGRCSRTKVRTYLKQTVALATFWKTEITAEALYDDSSGWRGNPDGRIHAAAR